MNLWNIVKNVIVPIIRNIAPIIQKIVQPIIQFVQHVMNGGQVPASRSSLQSDASTKPAPNIPQRSQDQEHASVLQRQSQLFNRDIAQQSVPVHSPMLAPMQSPHRNVRDIEA